MIVDPMVGYWCRVGSQALTHTRNDVAILVQWRTLLSILFSHPPSVCTKVVFYCTDNRAQHEAVVNTDGVMSMGFAEAFHGKSLLIQVCSSGSAGRVCSLGPKSSPGAL